VWLFGRDVGPYMNALHFFFGLGAFLSPLLIDRVMVIGGGIRLAFWLLALLIVPVAFWMTRIPSPSPQKQEERAQGTTAARYGWLTLLVAGLMFLHVGGEISYGGWIFSYALALNFGPETTARLLNSVYWGALTLGRLIAIPVAAWLLPRTMLLIDLIGAAISIGVVLLLSNWGPALWVGTFGFGLSLASFYASMMNFTERRMPITGRVTSYILVGANAGSMTIPWLIGQLFESVGPRAMMGTIGVDILVSLVLFGVTLAYVSRFPMRAAMGQELDPA
jgi:FHS family Na+ dependent glucose MFS transporter 1